MLNDAKGGAARQVGVPAAGGRVRPPVHPAMLRPLLRGNWGDPRSALESLGPYSGPGEVFQVAARNVLARARRSSVRRGDVEDLAAYALVHVVNNAARQRGLAPPSGFSAWVDARGWLTRLAMNACWDSLRLVVVDSRPLEPEEGDSPREGTPEGGTNTPGTSATDPVAPDEQVNRRRALELVCRILAGQAGTDSSPVAPLHLLAVVLLALPSLLTRPMVDAAAATPDRAADGTVTGLCRRPAESHALLLEWRELHESGADSDASRTHLAWVLRSCDATSPARWQASNLDDCKRGRDTLRQWYARGVRDLRECLGLVIEGAGGRPARTGVRP